MLKYSECGGSAAMNAGFWEVDWIVGRFVDITLLMAGDPEEISI